jgi:voltage-gated sodium channel
MSEQGSAGSGTRARLMRVLDTRAFELTILVVIVLNAVTLGLETTDLARSRAADTLAFLDRLFISIFVAELLLKAFVYRGRLLRDPWYVFDFVVVGIALLPATGPLAVLRTLRVLRVLRLVSSLPALRRVVNGLLASLPGLGSIAALLVLVFYVGAVMATSLFGETFPQWFGDIGNSAFSLFQVMTLESWSMGIVRPVMEEHPYAWAFFVPFILVTSLTVLNLFIAVIVDSMAHMQSHPVKPVASGPTAPAHDRLRELSRRAELLVADLETLSAELEAERRTPGPGRTG